MAANYSTRGTRVQRTPASTRVAGDSLISCGTLSPPHRVWNHQSLPLSSQIGHGALKYQRQTGRIMHRRTDSSTRLQVANVPPPRSVTESCMPLLASADPVGSSQPLSILFAKVSGSGIALGSILLFTPIILNILRHKTGEGISIATFWMQLIGFSAIFLYNTSKGFPLAAYGENASLAVQSLIILFLAQYFSKKGIQKRFCFGLLAYGTWVASCLAGLVPANAMFGMQVLAMIIITGAIVPQIILNFKRKDTGEWSIITAIMSTGGNAIRIFTTLQLTHDPLLLTGYLLGFAVNATLLWQIIAYRKPANADVPGRCSSI